MLARATIFFYGAALITLPWAGVGVLKLSTGRDWGGGLQPSWLFLALAMLCFALDRLPRGFSTSTWALPVSPGLRKIWVAGFFAVVFAVLLSLTGLWWAPSGEALSATLARFAKQFVQLAIMSCFVVWPALWTRGKARWIWSVKLLLIGGLIQAAYGLIQGIDYYHAVPGFRWLEGVCTSNPSILSGSGELYLGDSFRHVPRLRGMNCEPLYLGNYLLFLLPLTLVRTWSSRIRWGIAVALLLLLLGTWSRGAWIGLAGQVTLAAVLVLGLGGEMRRKVLGITTGRLKVVLLAIGGVILLIPLVGLVSGWDQLLFPYRRLVQTFSGQDWSNLTRLYSMQAGWRAFLLNPVTGVGWGQFGWHFPLLVDPMGLQSQFTWPVVNSFPLLVLCETGLVGILVFAGWTGGLAKGVLHRWNLLRGSETNGASFDFSGRVLFATTLAVAGVWIQLMTFSQYNLSHIWISVGLMLAFLADSDEMGTES